jgi:glycosyltransferase involved in cell wall biosynthesis
LRVLHAIHDFLPRHRAGSEIYAFELGRELSRLHDVTILCADYDPSRAHGFVDWRLHGGLPVAEIVNNWVTSSFADTYRPPVVGEQLEHVLQAVQPDVLHVHNLLNLSFDLPVMARDRGIAVVATLHDYTLVCASGGQRVHVAERHRCDVIDTTRCARCFCESPFYAQSSFAAWTASWPRSVSAVVAQGVKRLPQTLRQAASAVASASTAPVTAADIDARQTAARRVFDAVTLFVAPSRSIAEEFERFGIPRSKIRISDYGFAPLRRPLRPAAGGPLRIGFVGTLTWHKGVHILIDAVRGLPDDTFLLKIFGDPDVFPDYAAQLREMSSGLPIEFAGYFGRERTSEMYGQIDLLVVPSLWLENSPLVIHEAFAAGVPVVGARIGGIADLVTHEQNGLSYEPASSSALREVLLGLIARPGRLAEFRSRIPSVKPIEQDALEWDTVYRAVARA